MPEIPIGRPVNTLPDVTGWDTLSLADRNTLIKQWQVRRSLRSYHSIICINLYRKRNTHDT